MLYIIFRERVLIGCSSLEGQFGFLAHVILNSMERLATLQIWIVLHSKILFITAFPFEFVIIWLVLVCWLFI